MNHFQAQLAALFLHNRGPAGKSGEQGHAAIARPFRPAWEITVLVATFCLSVCNPPTGMPWTRTRSSIF